eukprot:1989287-Rhodomonas_salina.3
MTLRVWDTRVHNSDDSVCFRSHHHHVPSPVSPHMPRRSHAGPWRPGVTESRSRLQSSGGAPSQPPGPANLK